MSAASPSFFDNVHAITSHDARVIIPLIPKCMNTSLLAGWNRITDAITSENPTSREQAVVHAPGSVPTITRDDAHSLLQGGYVIVAVVRDPMDRLISFFLNKGRYLANGENWDWIIKRSRGHPVGNLPRWFRSGPASSRRAFGDALSQVTFRQFVTELALAFEAARACPKLWTRMNKHVTPYHRVFDYLLADDPNDNSSVKTFDMSSDLSGLERLLCDRGLSPSIAAKMIGTRANVNPKGHTYVPNADVLRPSAFPVDMSYESFKAEDLTAEVRCLYKDDYDIMAMCVNRPHHPHHLPPS